MKKTNTLLWALGFALLAGGAQAQSSGDHTEGTGMDAPPRADTHEGDKTSVGPSTPETGTTTTSPDGVSTSTTPTPGSTPDPGTGSGGSTTPGNEDPGHDATNPGATSPTNPTGNDPGESDTLRRRR